MAPGYRSTASGAESPAPLVRVRGLVAGYGRGRRRIEVLRGVDLEAETGQVTALVGPNGAGKTTLLRILLGYVSPWSGSVDVGGVPPASYRRLRGAGHLPERVQPPAGWRVGELFLEGARLSGIRGDAGARAVVAALRRSGLEAPTVERLLSDLSQGTARRVQLAFALIGSPELVLLDEPWSGLDPPARARLRETIRELADDGATVLLASHEMDEVQRTADRAILLREGRVLRVVRTPSRLPPGGLESLLLEGDRRA